MTIKGRYLTFKQFICLVAYYSIAIYLPDSNGPIKWGTKVRRFLCVRIFKKAGKGIMIHRGANFGGGLDIEIGDNSDIGINANIPGNTIIGDNVLMGPNCYIFASNHEFKDVNIPMKKQGFTEKKQAIIGDDVWIGRNVTLTPGRHISSGTIVGAGCVLTKDFPEYSVVGGNPGRLIRMRK